MRRPTFQFLRPAHRMLVLAAAVTGATALVLGAGIGAAAAEPTWSVPSTAAVSSAMQISGTECTGSGVVVVLQLFAGTHAADWVWRTDPDNKPAGLGNSTLPDVNGNWSTGYSVASWVTPGTYTMTGECTSDPGSGGNGFYYGNVTVEVTAASAATTTTTPTVPRTTTTAAPVTTTTAAPSTTAPAVPVTAAATTTTRVAVRATATLPRTGSHSGPAAVVAVALVSAGSLLALTARRDRYRTHA